MSTSERREIPTVQKEKKPTCPELGMVRGVRRRTPGNGEETVAVAGSGDVRRPAPNIVIFGSFHD